MNPSEKQGEIFRRVREGVAHPPLIAKMPHFGSVKRLLQNRNDQWKAIFLQKVDVYCYLDYVKDVEIRVSLSLVHIKGCVCCDVTNDEPFAVSIVAIVIGK